MWKLLSAFQDDSVHYPFNITFDSYDGGHGFYPPVISPEHGGILID
jgi:hypothetical protein